MLLSGAATLTDCSSGSPSFASLNTNTPAQSITPTDAPSSPPPSATPTLEPTALPPNPLSIQALRQRAYPGSNLTIEQTLAPGQNYTRYIASYVSDGLKINALLTIPNGARPMTGWPVIIFNHGYIPPGLYKTTERYVAYVDAIAKSGYIVLKSDYRGHGTSEGQATGGYGTPDYTIDVLNAIGSIKRYKDADPNRIGMWGHSMGGLVTLRSMVVSRDIKAGVIWSGVVASYPDLIAQWRLPASVPTPTIGRRWRQDLTSEYGTPEENPQFWNSISPASYLQDLAGPLQLHASKTDPEVPWSFSQELYQQTLATGKSAEFFSYPNDDHNLSKNFSAAMQRSIAFFDQHVKK
jgi:dipeptidyl aminopeptidase/acylaminoacyl peptidase